MDWSFIVFIEETCVVVATVIPVYLFWASGYLAVLVRAARANGWGLGKRGEDEKARELERQFEESFK